MIHDQHLPSEDGENVEHHEEEEENVKYGLQSANQPHHDHVDLRHLQKKDEGKREKKREKKKGGRGGKERKRDGDVEGVEEGRKEGREVLKEGRKERVVLVNLCNERGGIFGGGEG
jgi:hypothetical protein